MLTTAGIAGRHVVSIPLGDAGLVAAALESPVPINVEDAPLDPRFREAGDEFARRSSLLARSMLCVRIPNGDDGDEEEPLGILQVFNKRSAPAFSEEDEHLAVEVALQLSALLPGLMQYEELQDTLRGEIEAARKAHMEHRNAALRTLI